MFESLKADLKIFRLFKKKDNIYKRYLLDIKGVSANEKREIGGEASTADSLVEEQIDSLITSHLIRRARRLFIPVPARSEEDMWNKLSYESGRTLTAHGITELRKRIRSENRDRRGVLIAVLSTLTGIIGALTGLVAIFMK